MNQSTWESSVIDIFTDGACSGNPGPGGYGAIVRYNGRDKELFGYSPHTTNNRMELLAAIRGLEAVEVNEAKVAITTDSKYVKDGISSWIYNWKRNGWRTAGRKPVKNADLWRALDEAVSRHDVSWHWVEGHSGHPENERADELARRGITDGQQGYIDADPMGAE